MDDKDRLSAIEASIESIQSDIHFLRNALTGDEFGNQGYMQRLQSLESKTNSLMIKMYMVIGAWGVITFVLSNIKSIMTMIK